MTTITFEDPDTGDGLEVELLFDEEFKRGDPDFGQAPFVAVVTLYGILLSGARGRTPSKQDRRAAEAFWGLEQIVEWEARRAGSYSQETIQATVEEADEARDEKEAA